MSLIRLAILASLLVGSGQQEMTSSADTGWPLGGVRLLPGYRYLSQSTEGCPCGTIERADKKGVRIVHTAGNVPHVVDDARKKDNLAWERRQRVNGWDAEIGMSKDGRLLVSYGLVNFTAKIDSIEDAADVLLMILGFPAPDGPKER